MQRIDFFRLERPIQERFVASAHGTAAPLPLAVNREPMPRALVGWGAGSVLALVAMVVVARVGYASLESPLALHPPWMLGAYLLATGTAAFCAHRAYRALVARRSLPFPPGVYVFPSGLIDTRGREFVIRSLQELGATSVAGRTLSLQFDEGGRFGFKFPTAEHALEAQRALAEHRQRLLEGSTQPSARELALLDPLCDNGFKNPFSPTESMRPPAPKRFPLWAFATIAAGAALGGAAFLVRNHLGEQALYGAARSADNKAAYRAYTERGGARPEVHEILLPRAELAEVVATKSLVQLERFALAQQNSKIATETDIALQHALHHELNVARRAGTLAALKEFQRNHGSHPKIAPLVQSAIEEHSRARLVEFEKRAQPKPQTRDFFRRLLAYTSVHGSRVHVRFRRRIPESVGRAEAMIRKSLHYGGSNSLPAQYFDAAHSAKREEPVGKHLIEVLGKAFPPDLVQFELAPALPDSDDELPKVDVPTLLVTHRTEMSGGYLLKQPRAALTGIGVLFRVSFQIPGDEEALHFKLSTWNAPDLKRAQHFKGFGDIYDEMAVRAFSKLPEKYLAYLVPGLG
jgi:hypothetical protein